MAAGAVEPVQFEFEVKGVRSHQLAQGRFIHFLHVLEAHVPGNGDDDLSDFFNWQAQAAQDFFGHFCTFGFVAVKTDAVLAHKGGIRFPDVVQQDCVGQRTGRILHHVEHDDGVFEYIAFGVELRRLLLSDHWKNFRDDMFHESELDEFSQGVTGADAFGEDAREFVFNPFGADFGEVVCVNFDGVARGGVDRKAERVSKAYGAQHAQVIFSEAAVGIADGTDEFFFQVGLSADVINNFVFNGIPEHSIDGEVSTLGVLFGAAEVDAVGAAAVLITGVFTKCGDFSLESVFDNHDDAEGFADGDGFGKKGFNLFGQGIGGNVVIFWNTSHQPVAHRPAGDECGEAGVPDCAYNFERGCVDLVHGRKGWGKFMKKYILFFFLLVAGAVSADWRTEAERFTEVTRDVGYKSPDEMIAVIDRAEGAELTSAQSALGRFAEDPSAFLEESGLGLTVLLILLGGFLLNLTPCVLPMIPVNIAIIGAGAQSESRAKGFALGGMYGLGIAAVYGVLGVIAVLGGQSFGALNSNPWFNIGIAVIFVLLALSMFGVLHIDFSKFQSGKNVRFKSRFATAFVMGGIAALLAGACVAPVVLAVLLLAQGMGTVGLLLPFLLGIGMALPWPFAGAGFTFLPKPGMWMEWVKRGFGVLILLLAIYYGKLGIGLLKPAAESEASGKDDLAGELAAAYTAGQPVFLDFTAEWCKNCKQMEKDTWPNDAVQERLAKYRFIKVDATHHDEPPASDILDYFDVQGLPTFIILSPNG